MNAEPLLPAPLRAEHLTLSYDKKIVASDLCVSIPQGELTVIIGPNACGKSTLLRTLSRLMQPQAGTVWLNGKHISEYATKEVARQLGLLPQSSTAPGDITVFDLVARGRYPHQRLFSRWREEDQQAVEQAMRSTGVFELAEQPVDTLFRRAASAGLDCDGAGAANAAAVAG
ncbi:Probable siderophore transport system ATP-binding protein YusV [Serratia plymuthica]|uniref:Probable siderophore transport system ATP-binding protein YusV n=1 Tax=Serratia plymuthica TaxID=82996 RepID=A0A2X4VBT5_SERPL|nr:Probable siderophore transport system ATP-binding protein YusV [Serratia plymuthica]